MPKVGAVAAVTTGGRETTDGKETGGSGTDGIDGNETAGETTIALTTGLNETAV